MSVMTYWNIGKRIVNEEQNGQKRASYGKQIIKNVALALTQEFGEGYSYRSLCNYRKFYLTFNESQIVPTRGHNLEWSHYKRLLSVTSDDARLWYLKEASEQMWSVRTLDRNVSTQYYERMLSSQANGHELPKPENQRMNPLDYIKNPIVAEFLGFRNSSKYTESQLEQALIDNLQQFIMELGKGFAFVERQKHITTETDDFYIDLVFYNYKMKCFVLFELKTHKLTHQDIGQLDMYVRMYDDLVKDDSDNPTIGVLLCSDTDKTIAKYSVLNDNNNLFASKYMAFMPNEEDLLKEIERQKQFFLANHNEDDGEM
ncbi:MAG: PDDEXK nuclease domain-containing protein [Bacteroidales bacterium]|nr:PDDEXK nuclease domain-containing protein [Bacteroidales bacterium]